MEPTASLPPPATIEVPFSLGPSCSPDGRSGLVEVVATSQSSRIRGYLTDSKPLRVGRWDDRYGDCNVYIYDASQCDGVSCGEGASCGYTIDGNTYGCLPVPEAPDGIALRISDGVVTQEVAVGTNGSFDVPLDPGLEWSALSIEVGMAGYRSVTPLVELPVDSGDVLEVGNFQGTPCGEAQGVLQWDVAPLEAQYVLLEPSRQNAHLFESASCIRGPNSISAMDIPEEVLSWFPLDPADECPIVPTVRLARLGVMSSLAAAEWGCVELRWVGVEAGPVWAEITPL